MARRLVLAAFLAVATIAASGCGAAQQPSAAAGTDTVETTIYFLTDDRRAPLGVRRSIARESPFARGALETLLAGPSESERNAGLTTAIPSGTEVLSLEIRDHTDAVVNLSGLPQAGSGVERVRVITQIVRTLVGLSGIERVWLRNDGESWGLWRMEGGVFDRPYGYDDLAGWFHICASKPGTEAVPGDCFAAVP